MAHGGPEALAGSRPASVFERLGLFAVRRRRLVVGGWLLAIAAALPFAPSAGGVLRAGGFTLDDLESSRARLLLERELHLAPSALALVYSSDSLTAGSPGFIAAVSAATSGVRDAPHVIDVLSHALDPRRISRDGSTAYDLVLLDLPPDDSPAALPGIQTRITPVSGLNVGIAGGPAFYGDIQALSESDLRRAELLSLPLAGVALLAVFGSIVAAGLPLAVGGTAVLVALATIFALASVTPLSIFVLNLATLLGLGLGVDYSLLLTSRFREELARERARSRAETSEASKARERAETAERPDSDPNLAPVEQAIRRTMSTAGRAVFFSGLTVLLGLAGLLLSDFMVLRSVGIAGALVVALAVLAALTLLPALLAFAGPRIDALAVRPLGQDGGGHGGWAKLARWVMRRPLLVLLPTLSVLVALGLPFLHVRFNAPDATILPSDVPSRRAYDTLVGEFGEGELAPLRLAIRTAGPATHPDNIGRLYVYSRRLAADPRIRRVEGLVDIDPRVSLAQYQLLYASSSPPDRYVAATLQATTSGDVTVFTVFTPFGPNRDEARALVAELRDPNSVLAPPNGLTALVGGGAAEVVDVVDRVAADFPRSVAFIVASTFLVLFVLLRSFVLPIKAILMNMLSITAAFGALVWVFQDGNLSAILDFVPLGYVETTLPVILFCVLFGLSMDYEVFLLSRIKEAHEGIRENREAVAIGLERSGRIVTSAALIVIVVAGSFALADIVLIQALGLGIALAVAIDATLVRALLVPATMRLLGDWNWWLPARLERRMSPGVETETELERAVR